MLLGDFAVVVLFVHLFYGVVNVDYLVGCLLIKHLPPPLIFFFFFSKTSIIILILSGFGGGEPWMLISLLPSTPQPMNPLQPTTGWQKAIQEGRNYTSCMTSSD